MRLFNLAVELFGRTFIVVWVIYLTAINTSLFNNPAEKFFTILFLMVWIILTPTNDYIKTKPSQKQELIR